MKIIIPYFLSAVLTFCVSPFFPFNYHTILLTVLIFITIGLICLNLFCSQLLNKIKNTKNKELLPIYTLFNSVKQNITISCSIMFLATMIVTWFDSFILNINFTIFSFHFILIFDILWFLTFILTYHILLFIFTVFKNIKI